MTGVFIDGAAGTTGLEIRERLAGRADLSLITLDEERRKDLRARQEAINDAEFVILCLPDEAAREAVSLIRGRTRVIDASSAHRVAEGWTYGFPELEPDGAARVAAAERVSNPGCYPTGFLALVRPLVRAGLIPGDWPLTVNAVSGYSGGGKTLIERFRDAPDLAFRAYAFDLSHKHLGEMRLHAGLAHSPVFAPSVSRAYRGMIVEVPLHAAALPGRPSRAAFLDALDAAYQNQSMIRVHDDMPDELLMCADAPPSDRLDVYVFGSPDDAQVRLVATLDNLGKGAGGAAVQNLNLMAGLDPLAGLVL